MYRMSRFTRGFTIIELLVVVAIISILAAVLFASFSDARALARDEARKSNLKELQLAIELYKSQNGRYPAAGCGRVNQFVGHSSDHGNCDEYIVGHAAGINFVPEYIAALPKETTQTLSWQSYIYRTDVTGSRYKLMAFGTVEADFIESYADEFARCPRRFPASAHCSGANPQPNVYAVYSAGMEDI